MAGAREERRSQPREAMGEIREGEGFFGMLIRIQGMPRWADDAVVLVAEAGKRRLWGRWGIGQKEERVGRVK